MSGTIDSIRQGRGMLPKNLHWFIAGFMVMAGIAVMGSRHQQERAKAAENIETRKTANDEALEKKQPDTGRMIAESASQAKESQQGSQQQNQGKAGFSQTPVVPNVRNNPEEQINGQRDLAYGPDSQDQATRHDQATIATSPILALSGDNELQKSPPQSAQTNDALLQNLMQKRDQPAQLSDVDKKLLEDGTRPTQSQTIAIGEEYLENAKRNEQWLQKTSASAETSASRKPIPLDRAVTPYTVTQGMVIPAVLVSPIDSDLPGQIIARTTQNIYDSMRGRYLLIPSGSLVYGTYNSAVAVGQDRLAAVFSRIIFPDGSGVTLGAMPGTDAMGQAGVPGNVDNHFWRMFGSSMLIAGIASIFEPKQNSTNNYYINGTGSQGASAAGQVLVDVSRSILGRNTRIPPTVKVEQGERFNIVVQQDLALSPYAGGDRDGH